MNASFSSSSVCAVSNFFARINAVTVRSISIIGRDTVKVVSVYLEEEEDEQVFCSGLPPDYFQIPVVEALADDFTFDKTVRVNIGSLCRIAHKIRAPEV